MSRNTPESSRDAVYNTVWNNSKSRTKYKSHGKYSSATRRQYIRNTPYQSPRNNMLDLSRCNTMRPPSISLQRTKSPFNHSSKPHFSYRKRPQHEFRKSTSGWYLVTILSASSCSWNQVIDMITRYINPMEFLFYDFQINISTDEYKFYICDFKVASKLYYSRGLVKKDEKHTLVFHVESITPQFHPSEKMFKTIRFALAKRYNPETNSLNLSKFYDDPILFESDCFVPLDRPSALKYVFGIISYMLPTLKSINLNDNKLFFQDSLTTVANSVPQLRSIQLRNNNFRVLKDLTCLKSLNLTELDLSDNPLLESGAEPYDSLNAICGLFPNLTNICDLELKKQDNETEYKHTPGLMSKPIFVCSNEAKVFARLFVEQYFEMFDTVFRPGLESFYHTNAQFSLVAIDGKGKNAGVSGLIKSSRNFLRVIDEDRQQELLTQGRQDVVSHLQRLPFTKHDMMSFTCDCLILTSSMIQLSVTGLYEQLVMAPKKLLISFSRVFVFTQEVDDKFVIVNDQLFVTNVTQNQYIQAFSSLNGLNFDEDDKARIRLQSVPASSCSKVDHDELCQNLVRRLSLEINVTMSFCLQLLTESSWNYNLALDNFQKAQKSNEIPREAFVHTSNPG